MSRLFYVIRKFRVHSIMTIKGEKAQEKKFK